MDANIKENVEKIVTAGKENGSIKTTTITQLLNDLGIYSDEQYNEIIELIEERNINLIVDSTEQRNMILDSSKISIMPKTLSVETIVKKLKYKEIDLDTEFQRKRSLWTETVKSQLLESLMIQLPIPLRKIYYMSMQKRMREFVDSLNHYREYDSYLDF